MDNMSRYTSGLSAPRYTSSHFDPKLPSQLFGGQIVTSEETIPSRAPSTRNDVNTPGFRTPYSMVYSDSPANTAPFMSSGFSSIPTQIVSIRENTTFQSLPPAAAATTTTLGGSNNTLSVVESDIRSFQSNIMDHVARLRQSNRKTREALERGRRGINRDTDLPQGPTREIESSPYGACFGRGVVVPSDFTQTTTQLGETMISAIDEMRMTRSGPAALPPHIHVRDPDFATHSLSPLSLYYYDETAPNHLLHQNDLEDHNPFRSIANQVLESITCKGREIEKYWVNADKYQSSLVAGAISVDNSSRAVGSIVAHSKTSPWCTGRKTPQPSVSSTSSSQTVSSSSYETEESSNCSNLETKYSTLVAPAYESFARSTEPNRLPTQTEARRQFMSSQQPLTTNNLTTSGTLPLNSSLCPRCHGTGVVTTGSTIGKAPKSSCLCCRSRSAPSEIETEILPAPGLVYRKVSTTVEKPRQNFCRSGCCSSKVSLDGSQAPPPYNIQAAPRLVSYNTAPCSTKSILTGVADSLVVQKYEKQKYNCCSSAKRDISQVSSDNRVNSVAVMPSSAPTTYSQEPVSVVTVIPAGEVIRARSIPERSEIVAARYKPSSVAERNRNTDYAIRRMYCDLQEYENFDCAKFERDNAEREEDGTSFSMCPTYSVSYKNYPNLCYDVVVPENYGHFFRKRIAPF